MLRQRENKAFFLGSNYSSFRANVAILALAIVFVSHSPCVLAYDPGKRFDKPPSRRNLRSPLTSSPAMISPTATTAPATNAPTMNVPETETPSNVPFEIFDAEAQSTNSPTSKEQAESSTKSPTIEPTVPPTITPTLFPTVSPTRRPSASPTDNPTMSPTKKASSSPTGLETELPTPVPTTMSPSTASTKFLTSTPSMNRSHVPSLEPTPKPKTNAPSFSPTISESSASPSTHLTVNPTSQPTRKSRSPTISPSSLPTSSPTKLDTESPSSAPSPSPTFWPTTSPIPSEAPSIAPTDFPSINPTSAPSLSLQIDTVEVVMEMNECDVLKGRSIITWETITADHIREVISRQALDFPLFDLRARTNVKGMFSPTFVQGNRKLQETSLRIVFDADFEYRSSGTYKESDWIGQAFGSVDNRWTYLQKLKQSGDRAFAFVDNLEALIDGVAQRDMIPADPKGGREGGGMNIFIIIGAAAAGLAVVVLAGLVYLRSRDRKGNSNKWVIPTYDSEPQLGPKRINTDILVERQDDISTLGEPTVLAGLMNLGVVEKDETVGPIEGDYDYAKHYGRAAGRAPSSTSGSNAGLTTSVDGSARDLSTLGDLHQRMDHTDFSDDYSFEEQFAQDVTRFEVLAPRGKLGMVIDTPSGGLIPVVHAIKDSSVLVDKVSVGDCLHAVDDEDTTGMTAMQVSKLISRKSDNPVRRLHFARARTRAGR